MCLCNTLPSFGKEEKKTLKYGSTSNNSVMMKKNMSVIYTPRT